MSRSHLRTAASLIGAGAICSLALAPAVGATTLSQSGANALTVSVAGNEQGTGNVTARNDGSGEQKTGDTAPPISDSGAQSVFSAGVLAQEAIARAADGTGTSAACAGLAGDGGSVANFGGTSCLRPSSQLNGSLGTLDLSDLPTTAPLPAGTITLPPGSPLDPALLTGALGDVTPQVNAALDQLRDTFGDLGLTAGLKVIEGRCTAGPGTASGSARIVDGDISVRGGGQTITLLDLPANPPPNTHLVTDFDKVVDTVVAALTKDLSTSLNGALAPLGDALGTVKQQVIDQVAAQVKTNLAPLETNVLDLTLNKQTRPSKDAIRVNALDLQVLPAAREAIGAPLAGIQIGNVVCGPSARAAAAAPPAPAQAAKPAARPTAVSAGLESAPAVAAPSTPGDDMIVLGAFVLLGTTVAGAVAWRRLRP